MKINIINPHGFCKGVSRAIDMAMQSSQESPIYTLGMLIHNSIVINRLKSNNIFTVNNPIKNKLELLDEIDNNSTLIISAHGVSPAVINKCNEKKLKIIDTTCPLVAKVHKLINRYLDYGFDIYYIGIPNHDECKGVMGINDKIKLISSLEDIKEISFKDKSFVINQTTLSILDIEKFHNAIKQKNNNVIISNSVCNATTERQRAILESPKCDLFIIVGDKKSSNTKKLYDIASSKSKSLMIESADDIRDFNFKGISTINISSGASTPEDIFDEVKDYLKKL